MTSQPIQPSWSSSSPLNVELRVFNAGSTSPSLLSISPLPLTVSFWLVWEHREQPVSLWTQFLRVVLGWRPMKQLTIILLAPILELYQIIYLSPPLTYAPLWIPLLNQWPRLLLRNSAWGIHSKLFTLCTPMWRHLFLALWLATTLIKRTFVQPSYRLFLLPSILGGIISA